MLPSAMVARMAAFRTLETRTANLVMIGITKRPGGGVSERPWLAADRSVRASPPATARNVASVAKCPNPSTFSPGMILD